MKLKTLGLAFISFFFLQVSQAQYTKDDSLRGSVTPQRAWWDLTYYDLQVEVDIDKKRIEGQNTVHYIVLDESDIMQIDLQPPLKITSVTQDSSPLNYEKVATNVWWIHLKKNQKQGSRESVQITWEGNPVVAQRPPWDGGFVFEKDSNGLPFVATANQGIGASVWWPCKDHPADEVDSLKLTVIAPAHLQDISNGRLRNSYVNDNGKRVTTWFVSNPINNYGVNINIGDYVGWKDIYQGKKGPLDLSFYALREHKEKARKQFQDVYRMLEAFEHWFGPYPFYEDGYKLVEAPYLGMEHQSSITYGNGYQNGYKGSDLSGTGWGLKWDFIIIHESGHEWFANNITYKDEADMWIHESFTNYSESLFTEYFYGKEAGAEYVRGTRQNIRNDIPIIADYNVHGHGSGDMYYKGGNMLHTIRQIIKNDELWREILTGLNRDFYHQTVSSSHIENYMIEKSGVDLSKIFDQYLRTIQVPVLEIASKKKKSRYRWTNVVDGFTMPVDATLSDGKSIRLYPGTGWQKIKATGFDISKDYYVEVVHK